MKPCKKCKLVLPESSFHKGKNVCKICRSILLKKYRKNNREEINMKRRERKRQKKNGTYKPRPDYCDLFLDTCRKFPFLKDWKDLSPDTHFNELLKGIL